MNFILEVRIFESSNREKVRLSLGSSVFLVIDYLGVIGGDHCFVTIPRLHLLVI